MLLYNNQFVPENELRLPLTNRAFQYNDGFFETIIIRDGNLCFWEMHKQRMHEAAKALRLQLPPLFFTADFTNKLLELATQQQALLHGRLKLKVWRAGAGLYTPETNEVDWLAEVQPATLVPKSPVQVGVCQETYTFYSPFSHFKGPNAPVYVLAGLEKKARAKDDMLLLDRQGAVAEFISSNVFWIKDDIIYTPRLGTGCINGVLRRSIINWCCQQQVEIRETTAEIEQIYQAAFVFGANVTGLRTVSHMEKIEFPTQHPLLKQLQRDLFG